MKMKYFFCGISIVRTTSICQWLPPLYVNYSLARFSSYKTNDVRVRFAPSPTGELHIGGFRTALYNYLFAKSNNGKIILRIEDTDRKRNVSGAIKSITENLSWAGVSFDEGQGIGGEYGPYIQSERTDCYRDAIQKLIDKQVAYKCFCTEERLQEMKLHQRQGGKSSCYDGKCRSLKREQTEELTNKGVPHCVRLKVPESLPTFEDGIIGQVAKGSTAEEGDFVILKSDGTPTYHLASIVDDHLMNITHVMRGIEWITSTPKHLLLYRYLSWHPPLFYHIPLLHNTDGSKLSKRVGGEEVSLAHFVRQGYSAKSITNWVVGSGIRHRSHSEVYTLQQLVDRFSINSVKKSATTLDYDLLSHFSRLELLENIKSNSEETVKTLQALVQQRYGDSLDESLLSVSFLHRLLHWSVSRPVDRLGQLAGEEYDYIWQKPIHTENLPDNNAKELLTRLHAELTLVADDSFTEEAVIEALGTVQRVTGVKKGTIMKSMRQILCRGKKGASIASVLQLLSKENSLLRLRKYIEMM